MIKSRMLLTQRVRRRSISILMSAPAVIRSIARFMPGRRMNKALWIRARWVGSVLFIATLPQIALPQIALPQIALAGGIVNPNATAKFQPDAKPGSKPGSKPHAKSDAKRESSAKISADPGSGNLIGHGGPVKAVAIDDAGRRVLTGSFDYAMMAWDISGPAPKTIARFGAHEGAINAVAFVPGGRYVLAAGDDGSLWMWDLRRQKLHHRFKGHLAKINHFSVSVDGRFAVTASWDRTVRVWDLQNLQAGPVLKGHKGPVNAAVFSQDGLQIYTASTDGIIGLWQRLDGAYLRPLYKAAWGVNVLKRLPGRRQLLWGAVNGAAGIIDARSGKLVAQLPSHDRPVLSLAAIAKPGLIATGGGDGIIRVMRIGDWAVIEEYQNSLGPIWALDFVPGGKQLYYGGLDDFATLWQVAPRRAFEPVASKFPRRFQVSKDIDPGERQFARKCSVCHSLKQNGRNRAGPTLFQVFGRRAGTLPGYPYSPALKSADLVWSAETIGKLFALGPEHYTPGSKMPLQKITDPLKRANLIAYLRRATTSARKANKSRSP